LFYFFGDLIVVNIPIPETLLTILAASTYRFFLPIAATSLNSDERYCLKLSNIAKYASNENIKVSVTLSLAQLDITFRSSLLTEKLRHTCMHQKIPLSDCLHARFNLAPAPIHDSPEGLFDIPDPVPFVIHIFRIRPPRPREIKIPIAQSEL
jgi:hypothetical protein